MKKDFKFKKYLSKYGNSFDCWIYIDGWSKLVFECKKYSMKEFFKKYKLKVTNRSHNFINYKLMKRKGGKNE